MKDILITIIICTYNQCESLKAALESLLLQKINSSFDYEIIVVDNNSKDRTRETVAPYISKCNGRLRYVFEPNQGLSYARNRGIQEAKGEVIAFTDDDAVADEKWLGNLLRVYNDFDADCVGGKVEPFGNIDMPEWMPEELAYLFTIVDFGTECILLKYPLSPAGANISFKKKVFNRVGMFSADLGRKGNSLLSREESDICYKIQQTGGSIYYSPNAVVNHRIHCSRLSRKWVRNRIFWEGRSFAVMELRNLGVKFTIRKFLSNLKHMPRYLASWLSYALKGRKKYSFLRECRLRMNIGYNIQVLSQTIGCVNGRVKC